MGGLRFSAGIWGKRFFLPAGVGVGSRIDFLLVFAGFCGEKGGTKKNWEKIYFFLA
jgi:hypothetical protein